MPEKVAHARGTARGIRKRMEPVVPVTEWPNEYEVLESFLMGGGKTLGEAEDAVKEIFARLSPFRELVKYMEFIEKRRTSEKNSF